MKPIKKLALQMAMATYTPVGFYLNMPLRELLEYAELAAGMMEKSIQKAP